MDILNLVDRSIRSELAAAAIYDGFAARFPDDRAFWSELAADEGKHAKNLAEWRRLLEQEPADRRPIANGYDGPIAELERLLEQTHARAQAATAASEAFMIALELESSELDAIYTELLQCSPLSRHPDLRLTRARELDQHHHKLVKEIRARVDDEGAQVRADLLELEH